MKTSGEVTVKRAGRTYAATYTVEHGMVHIKTHTETRAAELKGNTPEAVTRSILNEIIDADLNH